MREEITVADAAGDRLQPEQPDLDGAAARRDRRFVADVPRARRGDPRRGLHRVQHPPGPRRVDRPARASTRTSCCCGRSRKVYGLCGLRVGYALCGSEDFRTAVDQVRQPFFCNAAAQAAALEALNHQDEVDAPRRAQPRRADRARGRAARARHASPPSRRPTSSGSTSGGEDDDPPSRARRPARASPSAASSCAPAARSGRDGALRVTVGTQAENERFLEALGALVATPR